MTEYTVHFQKGNRVGARSLHMVHVEADSTEAAVRLAKGQCEPGYRLVRVDHFEPDTYSLVIDY